MSPASFSRHPSPSSFLLDRNSTEKSACRAFLNYRFAQLSSISELNGNKEEGEGEERKDSRRSLTEIHCFVYCLDLDAIESNRDWPRGQFSRISENEKEKRRGRRRETKKRKIRENVDRKVGLWRGWNLFFTRQHRALCQRERVRRCFLMQRDCPDIYICTPKISSLVRVRIIVFSSRLKSDLLRNS